MIDLFAPLEMLEIKRAIVLITDLFDLSTSGRDKEYKELKEIADEFRKGINQVDETIDKFNKTGKF